MGQGEVPAWGECGSLGRALCKVSVGVWEVSVRGHCRFIRGPSLG